MGLYSRYIFPRIMEMALGSYTVSRYRKEALANVSGEILELGFGTGLNLSCYPENIRKITAIDANAGMNSQAKKRIEQSGITVAHHVLDAARLPFADNYFDSVVSTWTLCSIANLDQALQEARRVLKPDGRFYFFEHGLSEETKIQRWQNRLNPINQIFADGCHLNREMNLLIEKQGFKIAQLDRFYIKEFPKLFGFMYRGCAMKE
jgi:ubiquinone/menaquinone biosynthesis C-methylase UbiE